MTQSRVHVAATFRVNGVNRIVPNVATEQMDVARIFFWGDPRYGGGMDHGWIITFAGAGQASRQLSFATEGGSATPVPDLSIEVDDLLKVDQRMIDAGIKRSIGRSRSLGASCFFSRSF